MKAVMVMFDSLNRHMLPPYGCDWVHAPNFKRLAEKAVTFDCCYVGSMPCMPARREIHTGRYNFLHRSWGPLEPFDDSMPEILKNSGVYTHLVSDHYHYWEEGGCNYHTRYSTWEISRGQEGDSWIAQVKDPQIPPAVADRTGAGHWRQDWINREHMTREADQPQAKTFAAGLEFLRRNHHADNWFLHIETFDPHEPFFTLEQYKKLYPHDYAGRHFDWPPYRAVQETPEEVRHCRYEYAALLSMCDAYLGKVLDLMDELDMWKDTMLIVNTDHGFLLGEHDSWAKCWCPWYEEHARAPLFIWDPRAGVAGQRRNSLVQTIDLAPTLLEYFGLPPTPDMEGKSLRATVADDTPVRQAGLFGQFGAQVNVTDGRYVYMRAPARLDNQALFEYTHMPTHMRRTFGVGEMQSVTLAKPFGFTKGCPVMKIRSGGKGRSDSPVFHNWLYDVQSDPAQQHPIEDARIERMMIDHMVRLMKANDAPKEQYKRLGLKAPAR
ncbi:MAG TPA: sulfatase [Phycisphaerae bacterium]|nr:sulfatase [Phycisphaerae bacterium]